MRHAHSGKIPFDCPFFSTAGHTLTRDTPFLGFSKDLVLLTVCPLARRKKEHRDFESFATVAVRGASWLLQRSPCSRAIIGYELLEFKSQSCQATGFRGPQAPDAGKGLGVLRGRGEPVQGSPCPQALAERAVCPQ